MAIIDAKSGDFRRGWATICLGASLLVAAVAVPESAGGEGWIELIGDDGFIAWKMPTAEWTRATAVRIDPKKSTRLAYDAGPGPIIVNGPTGKATNILTKRAFGDVEAHFEFFIPKGSNSGVKFEGLYEIQISDSFGIPNPTASHAGGIYPRAEMEPVYHHIDEGYPPRVNAARPAGEWQGLDVTFRAPKFDASGKKVANARFERVVLNGQVVQRDVEVEHPTGNAWHDREVPVGPLLLQADHGPVAFRNIRIRPLGDP